MSRVILKMCDLKKFVLTEQQQKKINLKNYNPEFLLQVSCIQGYYTLAKRLLKNKVDPNTRRLSKMRKSPLHHATSCGQINMVNLLLNHGAEINGTDIFGMTALHIAVLKKNVKLTKLFLMRNANTEGKTVKRKFTPLHIAALNNDVAIIKLLLKHGAEISAVSDMGTTPLHLALVQNSPTAVQLLLENNAAVDWACGEIETPLYYACLYCETENIRALLNYKANVHFKCAQFKNSMLHALAINYGRKSDEELAEAALILLDHGTDVNCKNNQGISPIESAISNSQDCKLDKLIMVYILRGANFDKINVYKENNTDYDNVISKNKLLEFKSEVDKMKSVRINELYTLYDLMFVNIDTFARVSENAKLKSLYNKYRNSFSKHFNHYDWLLTNYYKKAVERKKLMNQALLFLKNDENFKNLPYLCCEKIIGNLDDSDLKNLIQVDCEKVSRKRKLEKYCKSKIVGKVRRIE